MADIGDSCTGSIARTKANRVDHKNHCAWGAVQGLVLRRGRLVAWVEAEARNCISHGHVSDWIGFHTWGVVVAKMFSYSLKRTFIFNS